MKTKEGKTDERTHKQHGVMDRALFKSIDKPDILLFSYTLYHYYCCHGPGEEFLPAYQQVTLHFQLCVFIAQETPHLLENFLFICLLFPCSDQIKLCSD